MPATLATLSNAMDVGAPSNFERLWFQFGRDVSQRIDGVSIDDDATLARMRLTYEEDGEFTCPHTAVGLEALERMRADHASVRDVPAMVLATAHPAKFDQAVERATGVQPPAAPALDALRDAPTRVEPLPADLASLRDALVDGAWPN